MVIRVHINTNMSMFVARGVPLPMFRICPNARMLCACHRLHIFMTVMMVFFLGNNKLLLMIIIDIAFILCVYVNKSIEQNK